MPEMIPVGNTIQPPAPVNGLGALSGILGVRQQQQTLQTGQYLQQTAQAESEQANQKNQELQALAKFTANASQDPAFQNEDGTPNVQKYQQGAMSVAPTYGQAYIGNATTNFTNAIENRKALLGLREEQQKRIGEGLATFASTPGAGEKEFDDLEDQTREVVGDDPEANKMVSRAFRQAPNTMGASDDEASLALRQHAHMLAQQHALMLARASGAQNAILPKYSDYTTPHKGAIGIRQTEPLAPYPLGPVGQETPTGTPPTTVSPPGNIPTVMAGGAGTTASGGSAGGPPETAQDYEAFGGYSERLNNRVQQASDALPRVQMAEKALEGIRGGASQTWRTEMAASLQKIPGMPQSLIDAVSGGSLADAQVAEKALFQSTLTGLRQSLSGDPARVAEFDAAEKVFPNVGTDPRATKEILNFISGQGQRDFAEQQAVANARRSGTLNRATWQADFQKQLRAGQVPGVPASQVPASAHKEGETGKSKSGKPTVYRNGRWEYQ